MCGKRVFRYSFFFFNDTAPTEIYTLPLPDALPIFTYLSDLAVRVSHQRRGLGKELIRRTQTAGGPKTTLLLLAAPAAEKYYPRIGFTHHPQARSEEHTSELQSRSDLVCRLLLEKKK